MVYMMQGRRLLAAWLGLAMLMAGQGALAQVALDNESGSSFKGTKRVAISQFGVEFYTQLTVVGRSGGNTAKQVSTLHGVGDAAMQTLTDQLYADTVAKLKEAGFEVVDAAVLAADAGYQALAADPGKPSPYLVHDSQGVADGEHLSKVFAPAGMRAFYQTGATLRGNMGDRFNAQNQGTAGKEGEIAKRLNATLLKFSFLANYGITKASKNGMLAVFTNSASRVSLETAPVLMPQDTQVQFVDATAPRIFGNIKRPGASGAFYLDKPLQGANIFETAEATPAETKKSDGVANAVFSLFGTKASGKSQVLEISSTDDAYKAAFAALLASADEALVAALKSNR